MFETIPRKTEPALELIQSERNGLQTELMQRFIDRGEGTDLNWANRYAVKLGDLVDHDEAIRALVRSD